MLAHEAQPQPVLVGSQDEVADDAARPAAGADAQARVAERVRHAAAHRLAEGDGEARRRVDRAAPAVGEVEAVELREGPEELGLQLLEGRRAPVELRPDPAPEVVDGVVAAPQDPVVGGQPEVVELVVGVGQALAPLPADRRALRPASSGSETRT